MTDRLDPNPGVADLDQMGAEDFAKLVAETSENQLAAIVAGYDHYEVVFEDGRCTASDRIEHDPQVTIRIGPVDFLKLAANQASGPTLFVTGKLRLDGDVMLASRLTSFFRIPSAG